MTTHNVGGVPGVLIRIDGAAQKISAGAAQRYSPGCLDAETDQYRRGRTERSEVGPHHCRCPRNVHRAYGLMLAMAQALHGGAGFAAATAAAMTNMKTLLAAKPRLSEEKQIGLVGELLLFRTLLDSFDENLRSSTGGWGRSPRNATTLSPGTTPKSRPPSGKFGFTSSTTPVNSNPAPAVHCGWYPSK